jgi:hypothetical protein
MIPRVAKHIVKVLIGKADPTWPFYSFERSINPKTIKRYTEIRAWADECAANVSEHETLALFETSTDPVVQQGYELKKKVENEFRNTYRGKTDLRILVQVPDQAFSPGGYSAFSNFLEALQFMGVEAFDHGWNDKTEELLARHKPNVLLITDHADFLKRVDWDAIARYKKDHRLDIGLLAHLEEYGNTPLPGRLAWAKEHDVRFYFSFRNEAYFRNRAGYKPFFDAGYDILPLEFGANILHYYPVPNISRDLDYVLLASANWTKGIHYKELAGRIVSRYAGFIDGDGWKHAQKFAFNKERDRYVYARGKVGLNFHLPEQIEWACEVNERTHQLAACGIPQLVDNAKRIPELYGPETLFVGSTRAEFESHFNRILSDPNYAQECALRAQKEAFEKHTTFHRADVFLTKLTSLLL